MSSAAEDLLAALRVAVGQQPRSDGWSRALVEQHIARLEAALSEPGSPILGINLDTLEVARMRHEEWEWQDDTGVLVGEHDLPDDPADHPLYRWPSGALHPSAKEEHEHQ